MTAETVGAVRVVGDSELRRYLVLIWLVWALGCAVAMQLFPGQETIPYHIGWAGFALAFGFATWHRWELIAALSGYTVVTGVIMVRRAALGILEWEETAEVPLMVLLAALMVWHVLRRQVALARTEELAEREAAASMARERLIRLTSHEMRTPLTIATGYVELIAARAVTAEDKHDAMVVTDELQRLARVGERLIRMIGLQERVVDENVDVDQVIRQAAERWSAVSDRRWVVDSSVGRICGSAERLRTAIDTLVENAIRYTDETDTIRLSGFRTDEKVVVSVSDSGTGLTPEQITTLNAESDGAAHGGARDTHHDPLAGTGLGLGIVREIANAGGGNLRAAQAPEGGAGMTMTLALRQPERIGRESIPPSGHEAVTAPVTDQAFVSRS